MSDVPAVPGAAGVAAASLVDQVSRVFAPDGPLARSLTGFECRSGQLEMAERVASAFERGGVLLAEAGTGTGKTLSYLIPAILSRQRVLISTGTKNLQEQIYFKDLPALVDILGVPFTATYMKGRANYLCLHHLDRLSEGGESPEHRFLLPLVQEWSRRTTTGDRAELQDLPEDLPFWTELSATAETCLGTDCPRYDDCFVTRMRQRAASSDVVIVNHHLLFADAAVRRSAYGEVIPACSNVILDEAHQLEDIATQYFGLSVSNYRIEDLARDIDRLQASEACTNALVGMEIGKALDRLRDDARAFFSLLANDHRTAARGRREERVRLTEHSVSGSRDAAADLSGALDLVQASLGPLRKPGGASDESGEATELVEALVRRAREIRDELRVLLRADDPELVYFVELRGKGVFLRASPVDVSKIVREVLLDKMRVTILTSATLTVDGTFEYVRARLGVAAAEEVRLPSEFDFARQTIMYLPPRMPDPRSSEFVASAARQVIEILKRTRGRAFVLFTSYATLRPVHAMAEMALNYPLLVQGTAPRTELLRQFRETPHAVLFATSSFWQGVDVAGEALSCVIIDKLPFASPGDPVMAARIDAIRARGGEPFGDYQVPLAILALRQGLGRLIRHRQDRGVLAVLDPRLRTKGYGRRFTDSLPPAPIVQDLAEVERFFSIV